MCGRTANLLNPQVCTCQTEDMFTYEGEQASTDLSAALLLTTMTFRLQEQQTLPSPRLCVLFKRLLLSTFTKSSMENTPAVFCVVMRT